MAQIMIKIAEDGEYQELIKAVKGDTNIAQLKTNHPAKGWLGCFQKLSLLMEAGLVIVYGYKIVMPKGMQIESVIKLHAETHGSVNRMKETIQSYCTWLNWHNDLTKVFNNCHMPGITSFTK